VATGFRTDGGDHPACSSVPAERIAAAAAQQGIPAAVDSDATIAVRRAMDEAGEAVPVVVSGSFHLLAAVRGASVPQ
jgi:dihydrofolate synthase/folylpolyglutamate synthase